MIDYNQNHIEKIAQILHSIDRAEKMNILRHESRIIINGCNLPAQLCIAVLKDKGYESIMAIDSSRKNLDIARTAGAEKIISLGAYTDISYLTDRIRKEYWKNLADILFHFDCDTNIELTDAVKLIHSHGGVCFETYPELAIGKESTGLFYRLLENEAVIVPIKNYSIRDYSNAKVLYANKKRNNPCYK